MISEAQSRLRLGARKPESVEFRDVRLGSREISGSKVVCGEITGENGFGGMSGFERFIMIDGKVPLTDGPGQKIFEKMWLEAGC